MLEFTDPEMANAIIYAGMVWNSKVHQGQLYDRACRVKQCFRCYCYGHIGTQCNASQTCGYCAGGHESRHCKQKGAEGFTPRCTVCKGGHTAWSNACPARKKELERVELAKRTRNIYWPVQPKERTNTSKQHNDRRNNGNQDRRAPGVIDLTRNTAQELRTANEDTAPQVRNMMGPPPRRQPHSSTTTREEAPQTQNSRGADVALEVTSSTTPRATPPVEDQSTSGVQAESTQHTEPRTEPRNEGSPGLFVPIQELEEGLQQTMTFPASMVEQGFGTQDAEDWLNNLFSNDEDWNQEIADTAIATISPPTSLATDTRTAQGAIYKSCTCPEHQEVYSNWPTRDAELKIAKCMRNCPYCGMERSTASELRRHLRQARYVRRNLTVVEEKRTRWDCSDPSWTPKPRMILVEDDSAIPEHRSGSEPLPQPSRPRITRSQSVTNSAFATPQPW